MCSLRAHVDSLIQQQQKTEMNLNLLQSCLDVIEADCQLSESSVDAVRQAKQHVSSCIDSSAAASDAASSWMLLRKQTDTHLTGSQVCALY